jgi:hypothetical protein
MFSARRSYSSRTSCSRGERSSIAVFGRGAVDSEGSIFVIFRERLRDKLLVWELFATAFGVVVCS